MEFEHREIQEINPDIPAWLCIIIKKMMAKRVVDQFQTADEIAELLSSCLAHVQLQGHSPQPHSLEQRPPVAFKCTNRVRPMFCHTDTVRGNVNLRQQVRRGVNPFAIRIAELLVINFKGFVICLD